MYICLKDGTQVVAGEYEKRAKMNNDIEKKIQRDCLDPDNEKEARIKN